MKIYVYPNAKPHVHDDTEVYYNTTPLSEKGIIDHCTTVSAEEADYFYMGQLANERFSQYKPSDFKYFSGNEDKHICDIEGEGGLPIPSWLHNSIITTMGPLKVYSNIERLFARPTFSHLLLDLIKNQNEVYPFPEEKSYGFRGYLNHNIRAMMVHALHHSDFQKELHVNRRWSGPSEIGSQVQKDFIDTMINNSLSLCPRGSGIDSVRLIETCYYGRVPILISDHDYYLVGEDIYDTSFVYRIHGYDLNPKVLAGKLREIYETSNDELQHRGALAKKYFDEVIRVYFEDPTKYFINWLNNENQ